MGKMVRLSDTCRDLGISKRTAYRWIESGELPAVRIGHRWKVDEETIARLKRGESGDESDGSDGT